MKEAYLQYIWRHKKLPVTNLKTTNSQPVEILDFGFLNSDSGPDFFNGKIKIGDQTWAGNIEVHVKSSEWYSHNHQFDMAYDNVILHVVFDYDGPVFNSNGMEVPTIEIRKYITEKHFESYKTLIGNSTWVPCEKQISDVDEIIKTTHLSRILVERLERKTKPILSELEREYNNWEEVFYRYFFRAFGLQVNSEAFLQLARKTPLSIIQKIGDNVFALEALLFGQAGLLSDEKHDDYYVKLQAEYQFLEQKHDLHSLSPKEMKFSKLRPPNFPTIRLAQLAQLLAKRSQWMMFFIEASNEELLNMFNVEISDYWQTHYVFDKISESRPKSIGINLSNSVLINLLVPFMFVYGKESLKPELQEKALSLLDKLAPEKNSIIDKWEDLGFKPLSAVTSQALLELKNEYCSAKKCLNCGIGVKILGKT